MALHGDGLLADRLRNDALIDGYSQAVTFLTESVGLFLCQIRLGYSRISVAYFRIRQGYCRRSVGYSDKDNDFTSRRADKCGKGIVKDLSSTLHELDLLIVQTFHRECYYSIEAFHAEIVIVILPELCRRIDNVRGVLLVIALDVVAIAELLATTGNDTVLCVGLDTFDETLHTSGR